MLLNPKQRRTFEKAVAEFLGLTFEDDDPVWCDAREVLLTGGWRAGKSTRGAFRAYRQVLEPRPNALMWLLGPDYVQTNEEFRYLLEWTQRTKIYLKHTAPAEGQRTLTTKTGWHVVTKSARYPERLGSVAPDCIIMCEPGQCSTEVYDMVIGRLAQKRGWLFMAGTLESDGSHPQWLWYENLARDWLRHPPGSQTRAFTLPSWSNKHVYPGGELDPEIQNQRSKLSGYKFQRRIAGVPVGVEYPCFPELWEEQDQPVPFYTSLEEQILDLRLHFIDGALGVDYGATEDHPSSIAVVMQDNVGRMWVREVWLGTGNVQKIELAADHLKRKYQIYKGRTDPNQAVLAQRLGFSVALGGSSGGIPVELRIGIANGLVEDRALWFDSNGPLVQEGFFSMRKMRRMQDARGRLVYKRDLGDDAAQAILYALEELRGSPLWVPSLELGGVRMSYDRVPAIDRGRV